MRVDIAFIAAKPATAAGDTAASVPPANITSASPRWMIRNASPIAFVPEVQAVTSVITGPLSPRRIDTRADVIFAIIIGTANGLTRPGPFSNNVSYTSWIESMPPIPVPTTVPQRSKSALSKSRSASSQARTAAPIANSTERSIRRASFLSTP